MKKQFLLAALLTFCALESNAQYQATSDVGGDIMGGPAPAGTLMLVNGTNTSTGTNSVIIGNSAGLFNTGNQTTSVGQATGWNNTGDNNTFLGAWTAQGNLGGYLNTFVGFYCGSANTNGNENTFLGAGTGNTNISGSKNTFIGGGAGGGNTSGNNNTALGNGANFSSGTYTNSTVIGANAVAGASNAMILGGIGSNAVNVGIGTSNPTELLHVNTNSSSGTAASTLNLTTSGGSIANSLKLTMNSSTNTGALLPTVTPPGAPAIPLTNMAELITDGSSLTIGMPDNGEKFGSIHFINRIFDNTSSTYKATECMRINKTTGFVGIQTRSATTSGTTGEPQAIFHVNLTNPADGGLNPSLTPNPMLTHGIRFEGLPAYDPTLHTEAVVIDADGNLAKAPYSGGGSSSAWLLTGNTVTSSDFIGTNNNDDFRIKTNGNPRARFTKEGDFDFGSNTFVPTGTSFNAAFGVSNTIDGAWTSATVGSSNLLDGTTSSFSSGTYNEIINGTASLGSGTNNKIRESEYSLASGESNVVAGSNSCQAMGKANEIDASYWSLTSGRENQITNASHSSQAMGYKNNVDAADQSQAMGTENVIKSSENSAVVGVYNNLTNTHHSFAAGDGNQMNTGIASFSAGKQNNSTGNRNIVLGNENSATGDDNLVFGNKLIADPTPVPMVASPLTNGKIMIIGDQVNSDLTHSLTVGFTGKRTSVTNEVGMAVQLNPTALATYNPTVNFEVDCYDPSTPAPGAIIMPPGYIYHSNIRFHNLPPDPQAAFRMLPAVLIDPASGELFMSQLSYQKPDRSSNTDVDSLKNRISQLESKLAGYDEKFASLEKSLIQICESGCAGLNTHYKDELYQSIPNPATDNVSINYYLAANYTNASISIITLEGKMIRTLTLNPNKGNGSVNFSLGDLQPGVYLYKLVVDGRQIDAKKLQKQ